MPIEQPCQDSPQLRKIKRGHSGCRPCRRRGKKCDEAKPHCGACKRLHLDCSYGVNFTFRSVNTIPDQRNSAVQRTSKSVSSPGKLVDFGLNSQANLESSYLTHFMHHVRPLIPAVSLALSEQSILQSPHLHAAILCLSASNLSMLNAQIQTRTLPTHFRNSVFSPVANRLHHTQARKYHDQALSHCHGADLASNDQSPSKTASILTAQVLLAYYHHASTSHLHFRHAVWTTLYFVSQNRDTLSSSPEGLAALQMWYRLCVSHRLGKPPALLLEGEGDSSFGPNRYPDSFEQVYLNCILGMNTDDLIYDILIKTIEIRTRVVVFRAVAGLSGVSEGHRGIGRAAHDLLARIQGHKGFDEARAEAEKGYMRGEHLLGLLDVQRERLAVWKTRLHPDQLPDSPTSTFPTHRDTMNALYSLLCEMILTETLLQFTQIHKSTSSLTYILDDLWPRLESKSRGYEHSHYPTHLVKRTIGLIAEFWDAGRDVTFAVPAVTEEVGKMTLLDVNEPVEVVVCGWGPGRDGDGGWFVKKCALP
ncbi:hypothetical protein P170DRAFT_459710 [Aspergillus steynii IBT 23096]|uniref:Zn(2)-C6 fungal-type domain-containing protein n=1 Tax=Aspergillus steynii IBT 23096 TaxID=1392250 RepID=A0A2I2FRJ2_9EURO|nr:uncharacterized protein P170DRAFT_459710 [Aspergillus steynii IBT 23096]PLB43231.1 hypothetical protein P170DRAFT_459710 [Aspergillus steynii IBT 23096]